MSAPLRTTLLLFALAMLQSCSVLVERRLGSRVEHAGGHDGAGGEDQLYFHLWNQAGHETGVHALVLPADWPDRARVTTADGGRSLAQPLTPCWVDERHLDPPPQIDSGYVLAPPEVTAPLPLLTRVEGQWGPPGDEERFLAAVEQRLGVGASAYLLRPVGQGGGEAFAVFGAVGPPLEWVHLCDVRFRDGRGRAKRTFWSCLRPPLYAFDVITVVSVEAPLIPIGIAALF